MMTKMMSFFTTASPRKPDSGSAVETPTLVPGDHVTGGERRRLAPFSDRAGDGSGPSNSHASICYWTLGSLRRAHEVVAEALSTEAEQRSEEGAEEVLPSLLRP